jgi:hypothetical protein
LILLICSGCCLGNQEPKNLTSPKKDPEATSNSALKFSQIEDTRFEWKYGAPILSEKITKGGFGGEIIRVTSLASSGPGSLREALDAEGPRTVVFEVAGVIDLSGQNLIIKNPHVSIAGQTAPSPGITLIKGGIIIERTHDVVVQHLKIRPGDLHEAPQSGRDIDSITTIEAHNVIVDHCSLSWGTDENLSASGQRFIGETLEDWRQGTSHKILFSNNIISEGLSNSTHAKGEHSKGSLIHDNVNEIYIYGNLYSSNMERSPLFKGGVQGSIINNFIYNPGQRAVHYNLQGLEWSEHDPVLGRMDLIGNAMKAGPSTLPNLPLLMIGGVGDLSVYMQGNTSIDIWGKDVELIGKYTSNGVKIEQTITPHFPLDGLSVLSPYDTEKFVLANAGARPWDRDAHDVRVLADAAEGRGTIIDSQDEVGGYPNVEATQSPFIPENWDLTAMSPKDILTLDSSSGARGT